MAFEISFSDRAAKEFYKLDKQVQRRIADKLQEYAQTENLSEAKFKNGIGNGESEIGGFFLT